MIMNSASMSKRTYLLVGLLVACAGAAWAKSPQFLTLTGHVAPQVQTAVKLQAAPADEQVPLGLVVNIDQILLTQTLDDIYSPNAPTRRRYLSATEFAQKFDLAAKRQAIKDFAQANGLSINPSEDEPESLVVKVSGTVSQVEKAFGVQLNQYRASNGQIFRAHDTDPQIPASLAPHLRSVLGLSNYVGAAHPHMVRPSASRIGSHVLLGGMTGPSGLSPTDIKTIYGLSAVSLTGSGQKAAVFELDGYTPSDITQYETTFSLPAVPISFIGVGGATNTPGSGATEVTLDLELLIALAPGMTQLLDYTGFNTESGRNNTYNKIATDDIAKTISTSWGLDEQDTSPTEISAENVIFQRMASQGQSIYAAAGDDGAFDAPSPPSTNCDGSKLCVDNPASQPYVTGVGGTSLSGSVASPTETTWNELSIPNGAGGGGVSVVWPIPGYQLGVGTAASQTARNVPDVALNADPNTSPYAIYFGGSWISVGGTSAAAPLWAAVTALINQERATLGTGNFGFANANLYQLATSTSSSVVFHDVTTGNNGHYNAGTGYDNATGWGSFKGAGLITNGGTIVPAPNFEALQNVYAFPNPWDTRTATKRQMTFANIPNDGSIKIFTLSGFWVKTLTGSDSNNQTVWDLTNDAGERVASGIYFYLVKSPQATFRGQIAIIK
jgi:kumamolisin